MNKTKRNICRLESIIEREIERLTKKLDQHKGSQFVECSLIARRFQLHDLLLTITVLKTTYYKEGLCPLCDNWEEGGINNGSNLKEI